MFKRLSILILPLALLLRLPVLAETSTLEEVLVVGQRDAPIAIAPRGLAVSLGAEQFAATNAINVEDLMKYAPNFFVRKRYVGDANAVPGFRGTHSTQSARSYIVVDGFLVSNFLGNSFSFPPKWGVVGPGEVQQFDIVYGPYSVRYPGNSMGGVVAISTHPPQKNQAFVTLQGFSQDYHQYRTDDHYDGYAVESGFSIKQSGGPFSLRGSYRHFENEGQPMSWSQLTASRKTAGTAVTGAVKDPDLIVPSPIFAAASTDLNTQDQLRLRGDLDFDQWQLQSLLVYWTTDSDTTRPTSYLRDEQGKPIFNGTVKFDTIFWDTTPLNLALNKRSEILAGLSAKGDIGGWLLNVNFSHFWLDRSEVMTSNGYENGMNNGTGTFTEAKPSGWWVLDSRASRTMNPHTLTFGITTNQYETQNNTYNTAHWRFAQDKTFALATQGKSSLLGIYVEDEILLAKGFTITPGLRRDQWRAFDGSILQNKNGVASDNVYAEREASRWNGALSSQWAFAPEWLAQLSLATATRWPTVGELFQGKFDSTGIFDPNSFDPNLRPEKSRDANAMLRHDFEQVRVTGSVFYQDVEDFIFSFEHMNPVGTKLTSFVNIDRVRQTGVEFIVESTDWLADDLAMEFNVAYIDDKILRNSWLPVSEGHQFPRIPYWRSNLQARYGIASDWQISTGLRFNSRPNTNLEATQRGDTYGYASEQLIADLRLSWQVDSGMELSFGIDNLNNDQAWAYHPFSQRAFLVELKWRI